MERVDRRASLDAGQDVSDDGVAQGQLIELAEREPSGSEPERVWRRLRCTIVARPRYEDRPHARSAVDRRVLQKENAFEHSVDAGLLTRAATCGVHEILAELDEADLPREVHDRRAAQIRARGAIR